MNLHEHQAKELLARFGVAVPKGAVALSDAEIGDAVRAVPGPAWVVKAQIHAGGRGKAGGIRIAQSAADAETATRALLGTTLVTPQTGPGGRQVRRVYVEQGLSIDRELYLGLLVDRAATRVAMMASTEGGMEIEEVAARTPDRILRASFDPMTGMLPFHARRMALGLGLRGAQVASAMRLMLAAHRAFLACDASLIEINPLAVSGDDVLALDAKIALDDNALFRHRDLADLRDEAEEDPAEIIAQRNNISYVKLGGDIGCLVNGAGLAMATMDLIQYHGGAPANFLDVGGGAPKTRVVEAFKIILRDTDVRGILVNIFAGINRCDVVASGIVEAAAELGVRVPMVVRLEGTKVEEGRSILAASGLKLAAASGLTDAAEKIVAATRAAA